MTPRKITIALCGVIGVFAGSILALGPFRFFPFPGFFSSFFLVDGSRLSNPQIVLDPCLNNLNLHSLEQRSFGKTRRKVILHTCSLVTSAPWFEDGNHEWPGIGLVNVLFAGWTKSYVQENKLDNLLGGWASDNDVNLATKKLKVTYVTRGLDDGSSVHFWFQGKASYGRVYNYMHVTPLPNSEIPATFTLDLSVPSDYQCLGSVLKPRKLLLYGCDIPSDIAMRNVNIDFGFLRIVGKSAYPSGKAGSSFEILGLEIK